MSTLLNDLTNMISVRAEKKNLAFKLRFRKIYQTVCLVMK